jgi:hypothetical protein
MIKHLFIAILLITTATSCKNLVPYTDALKVKNNWSDDDIKKIQFYVSEDIVLQRQLNSANTEIVDGKIKIVDGKQVEEIVIRRGTPGVLTNIPRSQKMEVSFEKSDSYSLSFGANTNQNNKFILLASNWNGHIGKVTYNGKEYFTSPESAYSILLVDLRKIDDTRINQRVAKGRKVK